MPSHYVVRCRVSGGVTGTRESVCKENGETKYFSSLASAESYAREMRNAMNNEYSQAYFEYWPVVIL